MINNLFLLGATDGGERPSKAYYLGYLVTCIIGASRNFCVDTPAPTESKRRLQPLPPEWAREKTRKGVKGEK
jgi:hypothetical protein